MEFSVRLKELRVDNDMSQTELAEKLNLKASAISKYEKGITQPSIDTLKNLAEIFYPTHAHARSNAAGLPARRARHPRDRYIYGMHSAASS